MPFDPVASAGYIAAVERGKSAALDLALTKRQANERRLRGEYETVPVDLAPLPASIACPVCGRELGPRAEGRPRGIRYVWPWHNVSSNKAERCEQSMKDYT